MIVYVSIGNSDDKLTQAEWAHFYTSVRHLLANDLQPREAEGWGSLAFSAPTIHGRWQSVPSDPWQNACWCVEIEDHDAPAIQHELKLLAAKFRQDSIAWAEVCDTEFLGGHGG